MGGGARGATKSQRGVGRPWGDPYLLPLQPDGGQHSVTDRGLSTQQGCFGLGPVQEAISVSVRSSKERHEGGAVD